MNKKLMKQFLFDIENLQKDEIIESVELYNQYLKAARREDIPESIKRFKLTITILKGGN